MPAIRIMRLSGMARGLLGAFLEPVGEFAADTFDDRGEESWGFRPLAMVELKEKAFRHLQVANSFVDNERITDSPNIIGRISELVAPRYWRHAPPAPAITADCAGSCRRRSSGARP